MGKTGCRAPQLLFESFLSFENHCLNYYIYNLNKAITRHVQMYSPKNDNGHKSETSIPPQVSCGFDAVGQNVLVSETDLRDVISTNALADKANWVDGAGNLIFESASPRSGFGFLLRYWLSRYSDIPPETLIALMAAAIDPLVTDTFWNPLVTETEIKTEVDSITTTLMASIPDPGVADLNDIIKKALRNARGSHLNLKRTKWSAVYVVSIIRGAAIQLQLEAMDGNSHEGKDKLLLGDSSHSSYVHEAYSRRFGPNRRNGTYHAFEIQEHSPQKGDIIIQDREATTITEVLRFADIPTVLAPQQPFHNLHGDIVIEVPPNSDFVITLGGNLGTECQGSVRRRRYPLDANRRLIVDRRRLYSNELNNGTLPPLSNSARPFHNSTGKIFALLRPVVECHEIPAQKVDE